ncbi:MAG TPA: GntR family transcriptional regulator [Solirubrobacteraceae bacterium]|nr:GntR family transcriptional regulator [Solirubrobacteraceae bacterium]
MKHGTLGPAAVDGLTVQAGAGAPPDALAGLARIESSSVAILAYEQIRALILGGEMSPGARLSQLDLAERLGVSRTPVREALRRLAGEGLVDALPQRGFRVADLGLEAVMRRLEVRLLLEPGIARLAAERAVPEDVERLAEAIELEAAARDSDTMHDASRMFHMGLARATHNEELVNTLGALWIVEVGRRLLARRAGAPEWQQSDISEHRAIMAAVQRRDGVEAERLSREHIGDALRHWNPIAAEAEEA